MPAVIEDSSALLKDPEALRRKAHADGTLFFRGLLDPAALRGLAGKVVEVMKRHGLVERDSGEEDVVLAKPGLEIREMDNPAWRAFYVELLGLRDLNRMTQDPTLLALMQQIFQEPVLPQARVICRVFANYPDPFATVPHRDFTLNGGSPDAWTCWIPLVEVSPEMGGLRVIPGSRQLELAPRGKDERSGFQVDESALIGPGRYRVGDVIAFDAGVVHAGAGNATQDRVRVSMECRYQPLSQPVRYDSMEPHWGAHGAGWEGIYAGWPDPDPLKYFWKPLNPRIEKDLSGTQEEDLRKKFLYRQLRDAFKKA